MADTIPRLEKVGQVEFGEGSANGLTVGTEGDVLVLHPFHVEVVLTEANLIVHARAAPMLARRARTLFDVTQLLERQPWLTLYFRLGEAIGEIVETYKEEAGRRGFAAYCVGVIPPIIVECEGLRNLKRDAETSIPLAGFLCEKCGIEFGADGTCLRSDVYPLQCVKCAEQVMP